MKTYDVIVVGGGPSGLTASTELAKEGIKVIVFEEHSRIGFPNHCAGLVSISCIRDFMKFTLDEDFVLNRVKGAKIYSPTGTVELVVERSSPQAVVLDRELMDRALYEIALAQGVNVSLNAKVTKVTLGEEFHRAKVNNITLRCKVLIDAEGTKFKFAKLIGANTPAKFKETLPATQVEIKGVKELDPSYVEVYLGSVWAPKFFAWIIPLSGGKARIGLASSRKDTFRLLKWFMNRHPRVKNRLTKAKIERLFAGLVHVGGPLNKTFADRALLIGDAGGFTKPTTGGGVFTGYISSKIAARVVKLAYDAFDFSYETFALYEKLWKRLLEREFALMRYFRIIFWNLPDSTLEGVMKYVKELDLLDVLREYSDIDYQLSRIGFKNYVKALLGIVRDFLT